MVRENVEISGCDTIEAALAGLEAQREMPAGCSGAEGRLRGDDIGRHILDSCRRPETEAQLDGARRAQEFATAWFKQPGRGQG